MTRTFLVLGLIAGLLLAAGCSSGNNKKNASATLPIGTPAPASSPTPLAFTPVSSPSPSSTAVPAATRDVGGKPPTLTATETATLPPATAAPSATTPPASTSATPSAATPPSAPPPPPPIPTGTARGGRDSTGATLPVGELCPLGYPVKGADNQKAYKPADPEYATIRPVACFQTSDDAVTAGYTLAHP